MSGHQPASQEQPEKPGRRDRAAAETRILKPYADWALRSKILIPFISATVIGALVTVVAFTHLNHVVQDDFFPARTHFSTLRWAVSYMVGEYREYLLSNDGEALEEIEERKYDIDQSMGFLRGSVIDSDVDFSHEKRFERVAEHLSELMELGNVLIDHQDTIKRQLVLLADAETRLKKAIGSARKAVFQEIVKVSGTQGAKLVSEVSLPEITHLHVMERMSLALLSETRNYVLTGGTGVLETLRAIRQSFDGHQKAFAASARNDPEEAKQISNIEAAAAALFKISNALVIHTQFRIDTLDSLEVFERVLGNELEAVGALIETRLTGALEAAQLPFTASLAFVTLWIIAVAVLVTSRLLQSLRALKAKASQIGGGDFTVRAEVKGADEVGQLAATFNEMASVLGKSIKTREAAQKALQILIGDLENRVEKRTATLIQEVERRKVVEEALTAQNSFLDLTYRISFTAGMTSSPEQAFRVCLKEICNAMDWPIGHVYTLSSEGGLRLVPTGIWHLEDPEAHKKFQEITESSVFRPGEGLPGRVMESDSIVWITDVRNDLNLPRGQHFNDSSICSAFAFPVAAGETYAVLEFFSTKIVEPDPRALDVFDSVGRQLGGIIVQKETEQKLMEALVLAETASQAKSDFLSTMSHEIRTPMNAVLGFLKIVHDSPDLAIGLRSHVHTAYDSANSLLNIINDILDISKLESGKMTLEKISFGLGDVIQDALKLMAFRAREKGLALDSHIDDRLESHFLGDPSRLRQVILNLVGNAIKFTKQGGVTVTVGPAEKHGMLYFTVTDTGIGIPPHRIDSIFDSFTQADGSTNRHFGGSGLGTTISRKIIELMGGEIWVESEIGEGSVFHFTINAPTTADVETVAFQSQAGEAGAPVSSRKFHALLVDDNAENIELLHYRLDEQGHTATVSTNGVEALAAFAAEKFDLVLMDIQMPVMDGIEATRKMRALEGDTDQRVPIIALTASVMPEDRQRSTRAGVDAMVAKPVDFDELFSVMERIVPDRPGQHRVPEPPHRKHVPDGRQVERMAEPGFDFSLISGVVDVDVGLDRWSGNAGAFHRNLHGFIDRHADDSAVLRQAIDSGNLGEARRLAHAIKGSAGNLAIHKVAAAAATLEGALRERTGNPSHLAEALARELAAATEAMHRLGPTRSPESEPNRNPDLPAVRNLLRDLITALGNDNPDLAEPVLEELKTHLPRPKLADIFEHVESFDFTKAKTSTRILAKELGMEMEA